MPPRMNQPNPPPPSLSSAIAFSSFYRANQTLTRHPHAVRRRFHTPAESGQAAPASAEPDIHTRRDVVHVLDGLSHLRQRLFHLFVRRIEQRFHRTQGAAEPDEDRRQGQRHHQGGDAERDPHEALTAHRLHTPAAPAANTPAILSACVWTRFPGFAARPGHEPSERLQQQGEAEARRRNGRTAKKSWEAMRISRRATIKPGGMYFMAVPVNAPLPRSRSPVGRGGD